MRDCKETSGLLRGLAVSLQVIDSDYAQLCEDAANVIEELLAKVLLWHPVSDPPKYADYYFVYDGKRIYDCYYFPNVGFASPTLVTHWTSIPRPQKVVE